MQPGRPGSRDTSRIPTVEAVLCVSVSVCTGTSRQIDICTLVYLLMFDRVLVFVRVCILVFVYGGRREGNREREREREQKERERYGEMEGERERETEIDR